MPASTIVRAASERRMIAMVEADAHQATAPPRRVRDAIELRHRAAGRLLDEHVLARVERRDRNLAPARRSWSRRSTTSTRSSATRSCQRRRPTPGAPARRVTRASARSAPLSDPRVGAGDEPRAAAERRARACGPISPQPTIADASGGHLRIVPVEAAILRHDAAQRVDVGRSSASRRVGSACPRIPHRAE